MGSGPSIPVLDLARLEAEGEERALFLADLRNAARQVGFFYVIRHGIAPDLLSALLACARRFFALPESEKLAVDMVNSPHFRGYTRVGWERTRGLEDWREQIDIGTEQPAITQTRDAPPWTRLQGPNQWPTALPQLRPVVLQWQAQATRVLVRLVRALASSLEQNEHILEPLYRDDPHLLVKLIRYPGRDLTTSDQGVGAHKDSGVLSLLLQDEQGGLQVQTGRGWVDVAPRAGTLVRERISAAFFLGARLDATVQVLPFPRKLAEEARGPERDPQNPLLREVGRNYLKGRLRSHPDVAKRHYADLVDPAATALPSSGY